MALVRKAVAIVLLLGASNPVWSMQIDFTSCSPSLRDATLSAPAEPSPLNGTIIVEN